MKANKSNSFNNLDLKPILDMLLNANGRSWAHYAYFSSKDEMYNAFVDQCDLAIRELVDGLILVALDIKNETRADDGVTLEDYQNQFANDVIDGDYSDNDEVGCAGCVEISTEFKDLTRIGVSPSFDKITYSVLFSDHDLTGSIPSIAESIATLCQVDEATLLKRANSEIPFLSNPVIKFRDFPIQCGFAYGVGDDYLAIFTKHLKDGDNILLLDADTDDVEKITKMIKVGFDMGLVIASTKVDYNFGVYFPEFYCDVSELFE